MRGAGYEQAGDDGRPCVLHVIDSLRTGGAEVMLTALVGELARSGATRNVVVAGEGDADPGLLGALRRDAEAVRLVPLRRIYGVSLPAALLRSIRAHRVDVVHSHLSNANVASRAAARLARRPHVTTIHTLPGPTAEDTPIHAALDGWSSHLSARLACPSTEIADAVVRAYRVPRRRLVVIPNFAPARPPGPDFDRGRVRRALLDGAAGPLVVCVARLQAEKGIDDLIAATRVLEGDLPSLRIVVAGDGPEAGRLRAEARAAGDVVRLLGRRDDIGELLAASDAFCLPSRHEGVPLSMLEAMEAGLPCVVTRVGGIPDLVGGGTALLVEPRDAPALAGALRRVLTDAPLAASLGAAGRELVEARCSRGSVAARYAALYRELSA